MLGMVILGKDIFLIVDQTILQKVAHLQKRELAIEPQPIDLIGTPVENINFEKGCEKPYNNQ